MTVLQTVVLIEVHVLLDQRIFIHGSVVEQFFHAIHVPNRMQAKKFQLSHNFLVKVITRYTIMKVSGCKFSYVN